MNQSNGQVAAISGGRGEKEGSLTLNRALHCHRQPGSASMIISTFAPAIDSCGATLASTYYDAPYSSGNQQVLTGGEIRILATTIYVRLSHIP